MKKVNLYATIMVLFFSATNTIAQTAPSIQHSHLYGGSAGDHPCAILQGRDGSFLMGGWTTSNDGDIKDYKGGINDAWVVKADSQGNYLWSRTIGGSGYDNISTVAITPDAYIVAGRSNSNDYDMDTLSAPAGSGSEFGFIAWLDPANGAIKQIHSYYGDLSGEIRDMKVLKNGNLIVLGQMVSTARPQITSLAEIDNNGKIIWQKFYGRGVNNQFDSPIGISVKQNGEYLISTQTESNSGDVHGVHGKTDVWLADLNDTGKILWAKCYGGTQAEGPINAYETSDGNIMCVATTSSSDDDLSGAGYHGGQDYWAFETNDTGKLLWSKCYGGSKDDFPFDMRVTCDGGAVISGHTFSSDGDITDPKGLMDIFVVRINSSGDTVWARDYGSSLADFEGHITTTRDNGYAIVGMNGTIDEDVSGTGNNGDFWFAKLAPDGLSNFCPELNSVKGVSNMHTLYIYPNPVNDNLYIKNATQGTTLCIYNILGQQLSHYTLNSDLQIISLQQLPEGSYLLQFTDRSGYRINKKIVKQ